MEKPTAKEILGEANCGSIGINKNLEIYGGYDDRFRQADANYERPEWYEDSDPDDEMEKQEKIALAEHMIALWTKYKTEVSTS